MRFVLFCHNQFSYLQIFSFFIGVSPIWAGVAAKRPILGSGAAFRAVSKSQPLASIKWQGNVSQCKKSAVPLVYPLLRSGCPAAIAGFVISVIVDSFYGQALAPWPHVRQEQCERIKPSTTNLYSPSSIVFVLRGQLIITPLLHSLPSFVCGLV